MKYLKIWTNFRNTIRCLQLDEVGNLFEMMLQYAETGKEPMDDDFIGNERFVWPSAKLNIDMTAEKAEVMRQNGAKGGRPKSSETKDQQ